MSACLRTEWEGNTQPGTPGAFLLEIRKFLRGEVSERRWIQVIGTDQVVLHLFTEFFLASWVLVVVNFSVRLRVQLAQDLAKNITHFKNLQMPLLNQILLYLTRPACTVLISKKR